MGNITQFQGQNFPYWKKEYHRCSLATARNEANFITDKWAQQDFLACVSA